MFGRTQIVALLGISLAAGALAVNAAGTAQSVHIDLTEASDGGMMITTSAETVPAGMTTFDVTNKSPNVGHEFLIARLETAPDALPFDEAKGVIKESALKEVEELGDLAAGASGTMDFDLKAGKYLLFCNLPGHYKSGMYHVLTVTQ